SKNKGTSPRPAGMMAVKAVHGMTIDQISNRITRWYEANPGRRATPVMAVIRTDMVKKSPPSK
ncbi:MAG: hypothetical protein ACREUX_21465, partial [Burkholderiales bacterium]